MVWYGLDVFGTKQTLDAVFEHLIRNRFHVCALPYEETERGLVMRLISFQGFGLGNTYSQFDWPCGAIIERRGQLPGVEAAEIMNIHRITL